MKKRHLAASKMGENKKSSSPYPPHQFPNIITPFENATTSSEKAEALKAQFFSPIPDADLSDIPNALY